MHYIYNVDAVYLLLGKKVKGKAIPVTGREGLKCCELSRLPHFLDNRLTDGFKTVSLTSLTPFTLGRFLIFISFRV
jgi:hypothetical protein